MDFVEETRKVMKIKKDTIIRIEFDGEEGNIIFKDRGGEYQIQLDSEEFIYLKDKILCAMRRYNSLVMKIKKKMKNGTYRNNDSEMESK